MIIRPHNPIRQSRPFSAARICCFLFLLFVPVTGPAQTGESPADSIDKYYQAAFEEIASMLDGKAPLSIKRAVFLAEWAYLDGELDYTAYSAQIDSTAAALKRFMQANNLHQFRTGANYALFEYFSRPYSMNNHKPFTYDFDDFFVYLNLPPVFMGGGIYIISYLILI